MLGIMVVKLYTDLKLFKTNGQNDFHLTEIPTVIMSFEAQENPNITSLKRKCNFTSKYNKKEIYVLVL